MESVALILTTVAAILSLTAWADDDGDNEEVYSNVTCDFSNSNFCGWKNQGLKTNSNLTWTIGYYAHDKNFYARLDVSNLSYPRPVTGELASPWLNKEKTGYNCTLEFVYFIRFSGNVCKLFLYQEMSSDLEDLWETNYGTGESFSNTTWVNVNCTAENYRLVFRGVHTSTNFPCGNDTDNEIAIDDIVYHVVPGTSTRKGRHVDSGRVVLGPGSMAPIIIAALAVVITIVCVIVFVVKRKNRQQRNTHGPHILSQSNYSANAVAEPSYQGVQSEAFATDEQIHTGTANYEYELVDNNSRIVTSNPRNTNAIYNKLGDPPPVQKAKPGITENHYDHFNDTKGHYDTTNAEERRRDQERELTADMYSHI
ncbi:uncharacterized protein [Littorina saxatilis]|uniref:uncharacterized protein isoform X2 n=1 Tax=Littorina saxatilis TaxID=31220 RepID=UPI0038B565D1